MNFGNIGFMELMVVLVIVSGAALASNRSTHRR